MLSAGQSLERAEGVVVLLHGRGGTAADILTLAKSLGRPGFAYLAPQAPNSTWYPNSFLAPRTANEPWLTSSLNSVGSVLASIAEKGIPADRLILAGFSQGACLASEYVATHPHRYGALIAFTGGLIGPLGSDLAHQGDLLGTPVFLGSGDPDPHVPWQRVEETATVLAGMGAEVTLRRYPGRPHTISQQELDAANDLLQEAFTQVPHKRV